MYSYLGGYSENPLPKIWTNIRLFFLVPSWLVLFLIINWWKWMHMTVRWIEIYKQFIHKYITICPELNEKNILHIYFQHYFVSAFNSCRSNIIWRKFQIKFKLHTHLFELTHTNKKKQRLINFCQCNLWAEQIFLPLAD